MVYDSENACVRDVANNCLPNYSDYQITEPQSRIGYVNVQNTNWPWYCCHMKSAREQVQDEILVKMTEAIQANDFKRAEELVKLAKAIKEL